MNRNLMRFLLSCILTLALSHARVAQANGRPCHAGLKGGYVTWTKTGPSSGTGQFIFPSGRVSVLPDFTWEVTGKPLSIVVGQNEPFSGGNSMKGFYGSAKNATNLNIRTESNDAVAGTPIPHSVTLTIRFNSGTPASGWGFSVIDIDVDQVKLSAKDTSGQLIATPTVASWFIQKFDADPSVNGSNIPSWDSQSAAVVGSESSSTLFRKTIEGGLRDTEAASAWFQPTTSLSELTFEYQSLQEYATPSFHVLVAACGTTFTAPTPTPATSGDSDGDSIPDATEGTGDPDNDDRPNYLDQDSDDDTIPDSVEGTTDTDGDGTPDFLDEDSDGDDVPDAVERDPDDEDTTPSGVDDNRNGIDDAREGDTSDPLSDKDNDGTPDFRDLDSDNDTKDDGDEAYDLDGDGTRDVDPSGQDENTNGIDDAFEDFTSPDKLNSSYVGETNAAPCSSVSHVASKSRVLKRLAALADRVPQFAGKARACGGKVPDSTVLQASNTRQSFESLLNATFKDKALSCPASVCPLEKTKATRSTLLSSASQLFVYAKRAKQTAQRSCASTLPPDTGSKPDSRPRTEAYLSQLEKEIKKLPKTRTACEE